MASMKSEIRRAFRELGVSMEELVEKTSIFYCPTIHPRTLSLHDTDPAEATRLADLAAAAFDAQCIIRGQDRRAFNRRRGTRAFNAWRAKREAAVRVAIDVVGKISGDKNWVAVRSSTVYGAAMAE